MSKKKNQRKHFRNRSVERTGLLLDKCSLVRKIQSGELEFLYRQSNRITQWKYECKGIAYRLVYDKKTKEVVTIIEMKEEAK